MKNFDALLLEALIQQTFKTPTKPLSRRDRREKDITVKQLIKVLRKTPELKRELEEALKALEPKKKEEKKDQLSFGQKFILSTVAAFTIPPLYLLMMAKLFSTLGWH